MLSKKNVKKAKKLKSLTAHELIHATGGYIPGVRGNGSSSSGGGGGTSDL